MERSASNHRPVTAAIALVLLADCSAVGSGGAQLVPASANRPAARIASTNSSQGALGPLLTAANGGTITGWDVDTAKNYGLLSAGYKTGTALETFDLKTAKITKIGTYQPPGHKNVLRQLVVLKILANDVALVDDIAFNSSTFRRNDKFPLVNPAYKAITKGHWTPPHRKSLVTEWVAANQDTTANAIMALKNSGGHKSAGVQLYISGVEQDSFGKLFHPPSSQIFGPPYDVAQDTSAGQIVIPMQIFSYPFDPFEAPSFDLLDPETDKYTLFSPNVGSGSVMGEAIDPATRIMCTTTATDSNVEFYDLKKQTGFAENIPGGEGQGTGGGAVAVDEINHLFFVTQPAGVLSSASVYVFDEQGNLQESIGGFDFSNVFSAVFATVWVNPSLRIGYATTANPDQLQSFTY